MNMHEPQSSFAAGFFYLGWLAVLTLIIGLIIGYILNPHTHHYISSLTPAASATMTAERSDLILSHPAV